MVLVYDLLNTKSLVGRSLRVQEETWEEIQCLCDQRHWSVLSSGLKVPSCLMMQTPGIRWEFSCLPCTTCVDKVQGISSGGFPLLASFHREWCCWLLALPSCNLDLELLLTRTVPLILRSHSPGSLHSKLESPPAGCPKCMRLEKCTPRPKVRAV